MRPHILPCDTKGLNTRMVTAKSMPALHQACLYHQHPHIMKAKDTYQSIRSDDIGY